MVFMDIVRGRRVGNSVVLTAPATAENNFYVIKQLDNGAIKYLPVKIHKHDEEPNRKLEL